MRIEYLNSSTRGELQINLTLFWCQGAYLGLSHFYKYTWLVQRGRFLLSVPVHIYTCIICTYKYMYVIHYFVKLIFIITPIAIALKNCCI